MSGLIFGAPVTRPPDNGKICGQVGIKDRDWQFLEIKVFSRLVTFVSYQV